MSFFFFLFWIPSVLHTFEINTSKRDVLSPPPPSEDSEKEREEKKKPSEWILSFQSEEITQFIPEKETKLLKSKQERMNEKSDVKWKESLSNKFSLTAVSFSSLSSPPSLHFTSLYFTSLITYD